MYENSDSQVLNESDFQDVKAEVSKLAANWKGFGPALGLSRAAIKEIDMACRGHPARCLDSVIEKWLNQDYNWEKFGLPSWKKLAEAVESRSGGNDPALAKKIRLERVRTEQSAVSVPHQSVQSSTVVLELGTGESPALSSYPANKQAGDKVLDEGDFQQVRREFSRHTSHWQELGLALGLSDAAIREIDLARRGDPSRSLDDVIERWLKQNYDCSQLGFPSWKKVAEAMESIRGESDPTTVVKKLGHAHKNAEQLRLPLNQVEQSVQVNPTVQSKPSAALRTSGITNTSMIQTHVGLPAMSTAHLSVTSNEKTLIKSPFQVTSTDELRSISQVVPSVAPSKHLYTPAEEPLSRPVEPLGPNVHQAKATHLPPVQPAQVPIAKSNNATLPLARSHDMATRSSDPLVPSSGSHDPPSPSPRSHVTPGLSARSHDPSTGSHDPRTGSHDFLVPAAVSHDPPVVSTAVSHDPPSPLPRARVSPTGSHDPLVPAAASHDPPVVSTAVSHDPPSPLPRSHVPPGSSARSHNPLVPAAVSHDPPVVSTAASHDPPSPLPRSHVPPGPSARSHDPLVPAAASHEPPSPLPRSHVSPAGSHDLPVPLATPKLTTNPMIPSASSQVTSEPMVPAAGSKAPADPTPAYAAHTVPSHTTPLARNSSHATEPLSILPVQTTTKQTSNTAPMLQTQRRVKHAIGLKALLNDLARLDPKWYNIGVLLSVSPHEVKKIDSKSDELLALRNVLVRWLSTTTTPMKSDLVKMLESNHIDSHSLAIQLQRNQDISDTRHLVIDDLDVLLDLLSPLSKRWEDIAIQLDVTTMQFPSMESISSNNAMKLRMMLQRLQSVSPPPTLLNLIEALRSAVIGEKAYAEELRQKYCYGGSGSDVLLFPQDDVLLFPQDDADVRVEIDYTSNIRSISSETQASPSPANRGHSENVPSAEMTSPPLHDTESTTINAEGGITMREENESHQTLSSSATPTTGLLSNKLTPVSAEAAITEQDISTAPASSSSISSSFASATGLASSRWCEKASQPIDSNLPDKGLGDHQLVPLNSSASNEFNAGITRRQENDSNQSLSSSVMSTSGLFSDMFCVSAVSAEPSLPQQDIYRSTAPSSFASATGLTSDRWCEKASQPIDSNLPDQAIEFNAVSAKPAAQYKQEKMGDTSKQLEVNEYSLLQSSMAASSIGQNSNAWAEKPISAQPSLDPQNMRQLLVLPSASSDNTGNGVHNAQDTLSMSSSSLASGPSSDKWCAITSQATGPTPNLPDQKHHLEVASNLIGPFNVSTADNMLAQGGQIRNEQNKMATVKDEDENMTGTSGVDNEHMSQKFCGPSPSQINSADLLPDEQKRVATVEDEEQSIPRASRYIPARNEQNLDSSSFNGSLGRFCGDNIQASDDRAKLPDQKLEMQAEGVLTQKELRSMASVEDV